MAITTDDVKDALIIEIGDVDPATGGAPSPASRGIVAGQIDYLWDRWAAKDLVAPGLREAYVKRAGLELILGVLGPRRMDFGNTVAGLTVKASQVVGMYERKLARVQAEIDRTEAASAASARAGGAYRIGRITTTAPVRPTNPPDGNDRRYGGDLYTERPHEVTP